MSRLTVVLIVALLALGAAAVQAVPPWELEPPVFVNCPVNLNVSHCEDSVVHEFTAVIPNQPGARGRLRYHLLEGPGEINEKSGRWVWYPTEDDLNSYHQVVVGASIFNTDVVSDERDNCRFSLTYRDQRARAITLGNDTIAVPGAAVIEVDAPGEYSLPFGIYEPDPCDRPALELLSVTPQPAGEIYIEDDTVLVARLLPEDDGHKFELVFRLTSGPFIYTFPLVLETRRNVLPVFVDCPDTLVIPWCGSARFQLSAVDPDFPDLRQGILYEMISPEDHLHGRIRSTSGVYYFRPRPEQVGETFEVEVAASYAGLSTAGSQNCRFMVRVPENRPLEFVDSPCGDTVHAVLPTELEVPLLAVDPDTCRGYPVHYFIESVTPNPGGSYYLQLNPAEPDGILFVINLPQSDIGRSFEVSIGASNGLDTARCDFTIATQERPPITIEIEKTDSTVLGQPEYVDILWTGGNLHMQGFDFLIRYDPLGLSLRAINPGELIETCDWEYFTYRYGPSGGCGSGPCPSGILRVVAIAETNNGDFHPSCYDTDKPVTIATIDFLVTNDRTYECAFVPLQFIWYDCGDNAVAFDPDPTDNVTTTSLGISRNVYDAEFGQVIDPTDSFPTFGGAPDSCLASAPAPIRIIEFYNGGVEILCSDSIDDRGDINLNGIPFEIADMVLFSNYFIYGLSAFENPGGSTAASDINADRTPLAVEDFVYGVRVISGDATPDPGGAPGSTDTTSVYVLDRTLSLEPGLDIGAVHLVIAGNATPLLIGNDMDLKYAYHDSTDVTHVLVYSFEAGTYLDGGPFMSWSGGGELQQIRMATYEGGKVHVLVNTPTAVAEAPETLPESYALYQNYPNPFNPETVIPFDVPKATEVSFEVYNLLGQQVYVRSRFLPAGSHEITWNGLDKTGSAVASGIYYYRLTAGDFSETRKMVLLK